MSSIAETVGATPDHRDSARPRAGSVHGLLEARQLLLAVAGMVEGDSPLIGWARELADLHALSLSAELSAARRPHDFDAASTRGGIRAAIGRIDEWAVFHLPHPRVARRHTHSLGEVISHVADTYAQVQWTLRHGDGAEDRHEAALRMAQVQQGYADLVDEIRALRVELPLGWHGPASHR